MSVSITIDADIRREFKLGDSITTSDTLPRLDYIPEIKISKIDISDFSNSLIRFSEKTLLSKHRVTNLFKINIICL